MQTYSVEPKSLAFLVDHNFDFNSQAREGVPFMPGNDSAELQLPGTPNQIMRDLFTHILAQKKPLVIHNGLLDLIFFYRAFYAALPETLDSLVADLAEMFPAGIVDTKYVADYVTPSVPSTALLPNGQISATLSFKQLTKLPDSFAKKKSTNKRSKQAEREEARLYCYQYACLHEGVAATAELSEEEKLSAFVSKVGNKLYLLGKDTLLNIAQSAFVKPSREHITVVGGCTK
ncbi:Target of EGR1, member 1 (Nuclear) [Podochytrium sp. JEL0797]|nr:Target of EGR1, member 1 (Nuclear) [Podochytrium sp. JEL0797]